MFCRIVSERDRSQATTAEGVGAMLSRANEHKTRRRTFICTYGGTWNLKLVISHFASPSTHLHQLARRRLFISTVEWEHCRDEEEEEEWLRQEA